jgi:hypothetical protein
MEPAAAPDQMTVRPRRTFHHDGIFSTAWCGWGVHIPSPFHSIYHLDSSGIAPSDPLPSKTSEFYLYAPPCPSPFSLVRLKNTVSQMGCTSHLPSSSLHILCYLHKRNGNLRPNTTSPVLIAATVFQFLVVGILFHPSTLTEISQVISRYAHYISPCIQ